MLLVPEMLGGGGRQAYSSPRVLLIAAVALVGFISSLRVTVGAEVYNVGDGGGWTTDTNYTDWAAQYTFREGDTIVFLYSRGSHDVLRVNQRDYLSCSASSPIETDASGETAFQLRAGGYYFICGFPAHCRSQQRVYVKVLPALGTLPHPSAGGSMPAYTQSAEGPAAATGLVPVAAPNVASRPQPSIGSLLMHTVTALALISCFTTRMQTV